MITSDYFFGVFISPSAVPATYFCLFLFPVYRTYITFFHDFTFLSLSFNKRTIAVSKSDIFRPICLFRRDLPSASLFAKLVIIVSAVAAKVAVADYVAVTLKHSSLYFQLGFLTIFLTGRSTIVMPAGFTCLRVPLRK